MRRMRCEVLDEWFYPIGNGEETVGIVPAPAEAVDKYLRLKASWLATVECGENEEPMVSLGPGRENGMRGYVVRQEIIYKPE